MYLVIMQIPIIACKKINLYFPMHLIFFDKNNRSSLSAESGSEASSRLAGRDPKWTVVPGIIYIKCVYDDSGETSLL